MECGCSELLEAMHIPPNDFSTHNAMEGLLLTMDEREKTIRKISVRRIKTFFDNQVLMLASVAYRKRKGSYQLTRNYSRKNNLKSRQSIS